MKPPAPRPCGSCPYRADVPSGVWAAEEYAKLVEYDNETWDQPHGVFMCHQQDGRICAGWCAVHDMDHSMAIRLAAATGQLAGDELDAVLEYQTDIRLYPDGASAAAAGLVALRSPSSQAISMIAKLQGRRRAGQRSA